VPDQGLTTIVDHGKSCPVGKLLVDRVIGKDTIKSTLIQGWRPSRTMVFKILGDNLFLIEFEHVWDKSRVLGGQSWVFEGHLFSVEDFHGTVAPARMDIDKAFFWVRMCETMGVQIGSSVGQVEEVETDKDGVGWGEYLRVRICLDLSKPIVQGRILKVNGENTWIAFPYEKLPTFCFQLFTMGWAAV